MNPCLIDTLRVKHWEMGESRRAVAVQVRWREYAPVRVDPFGWIPAMLLRWKVCVGPVVVFWVCCVLLMVMVVRRGGGLMMLMW
mgnify:CR=1 FL=1